MPLVRGSDVLKFLNYFRHTRKCGLNSYSRNGSHRAEGEFNFIKIAFTFYFMAWEYGLEETIVFNELKTTGWIFG